MIIPSAARLLSTVFSVFMTTDNERTISGGRDQVACDGGRGMMTRVSDPTRV